jgi:hypothetical protein
LWANADSNGYADIKPDRNANCASHGNPHSYTYSASYGYTYRHGNAKLHPVLRVHHLHRRHDRSGDNRHWQPR